ncbi:recombinase family protein [Corynebacterium striatum]
MKWAIRRRFQQGQHNGFSLYGYTNHGKGRIEINETEAAVVRRIFEYYLAKVSAEQMARIFEAEGVVGPTGAALEATTIRNILRNEKYTGNSLFQNTSRSALAATLSSTKESKTSTGSKTRIRPSSILTCGSRFKTREKTAGRKGPRQTGRSRPQTSPTWCTALITLSITGHRYAHSSTGPNGAHGHAP